MSKLIMEEIERLVAIEAENKAKQDLEYKDKYYDLVSDIKDIIKEAKAAKERMADHELNFNLIEAEGYLRCAIDLEECLRMIEDS